MSTATWMAIGMIVGAIGGIPLGPEGMIAALAAGAVAGYLISRYLRKNDQ